MVDSVPFSDAAAAFAIVLTLVWAGVAAALWASFVRHSRHAAAPAPPARRARLPGSAGILPAELGGAASARAPAAHPTRKTEIWRAATAQSEPFNFSTSQPFNFSTGNAYSYTVAIDEDADGVPLVMRGRLLSTAVPGANGAAIATTYAYDGASSRVISVLTTGSPTVTYGYNERGERVRTSQDGKAILTDTYYETIDQQVYRVNTAKLHADGSRIAYSHTDNGRPTRTTWARGAWREHSYGADNLVGGTTYSGTAMPSVAYTYYDSDKVASASLSDGTAYAYDYDDRLLCTNESVTVGGETFAVNRTYDEFHRAKETAVVVTNVKHSSASRLYDAEDRNCGYAITNAAGRSVSVAFAYGGSHLTNTVFTMPNGSIFSVKLTRETSRKHLVTRRDYSFNDIPIYWYSTEYDLLSRPTNATDSAALDRAWRYNHRSELASANVGANRLLWVMRRKLPFRFRRDGLGRREEVLSGPRRRAQRRLNQRLPRRQVAKGQQEGGGVLARSMLF